MVIEGWRGINHSFAIVNQFQLLEMYKRSGFSVWHADMPFHYANWSRATNGAGFHEADENTLASFPTPTEDLRRDWTYRIFSTVDLRPCQFGGRLAVFLVTELGLDELSLVAGSDIRQFESAGNIIVTPSNWSRDRLIDWGFQPGTVQVVAHGVSPAYFYPLPAQTIQNQRSALGFRQDEVILLNIGAAIWNKGIDVLLKAFAMARQQRKDLRLVFKDQRSTYGLSGDTFVRATLAAAGMATDDVLNAITLIPSNLTMDQMNAIYAMADCYVSPYRAEGFNLPVLEAMACETPVIVTAGGATDDFIDSHLCRTVESELFRNAVIQTKHVSGYCEPNPDHLVQLLIETRPKDIERLTSNTHTRTQLGWDSVTSNLLDLMSQ